MQKGQSMRHGNATWDDSTNAGRTNSKFPLKQTHRILTIRAYNLRRGTSKIFSTYFEDNDIWSKVSDHVKVIFLKRLHSAAANAMQVNRRCTKVEIASCAGIET